MAMKCTLAIMIVLRDSNCEGREDRTSDNFIATM